MRKFNIVLLGLLVIQVILVAVVHDNHGQIGATPAGPYVKLDQHALTALVISDGDGNSVTLKHTKSGWQTPDKFDFPIDKQRLAGLINGLNGARPDLPVAVSKDARDRFHVAKDKFERHLVFKTDQGVAADLYLGNTAGAGHIYARLGGKNAIQDLQFPLWRASAKVDDWLDQSYLEPQVSNLKTIRLPNVTLTRTDQHWAPQGLADDRVPDQDQIESLLDRLRTLQWQTLEGRQDEAHLPAHGTFKMTVTPNSGKALTYRFYKTPGKIEGKNKNKNKKRDNPTWRVTRSDSDLVFTIDDDRVEPLYTAKLAALTKAKSAPSKTKASKDDQGNTSAKSANMSPVKQ